MKIIKCTLFLLLVFCKFSYSQARDDGKLPEFQQISTRLKNIVGWKKGADLKWVSHKYYISEEKDDLPRYRSQNPNMVWLETRQLNYNGQDYYILLYGNIMGAYRWYYIKEGWENTFITNFFVLTKNSYDNFLKDLKTLDGANHQLISDIHGEYVGNLGEKLHTSSDKDIIPTILLYIDSKIKSPNTLLFNSQKVNGTDVVSFILPAEHLYANDNLQDSYFEVPFDKLIMAIEFNKP